MSICFTDENIKKLYKSINVICTKNSYPLLRRLSNNYINYYLKNSYLISKQFDRSEIDKNTIALVKKINHETNVYHHSYKVERVINFSSELKQSKNIKQKGGVREQYSYPNIDISRSFIGGGSKKTTNSSKLSSKKGFDKQCETIINKIDSKSITLTKDAKSYLHMLTENFLMKIALNAVSLNKETKHTKHNKISRVDIVNALP
jgi:hypothetical protein